MIFGLFLYMGISSMTGNTMFERAEVMGIWETDNLPKESLFRKGAHEYAARSARVATNIPHADCPARRAAAIECGRFPCDTCCDV